ncbi:MAG: VWA domain-containing protein [Calditrichaeota bacterium]|nr:VWA domain-containing protein [Calditrichota bacterium]
MIQFLNPTILFALAAASIPLIIHLLSRRKIKRVPFSTIQFLKRLERKQMRTFRLRQWILLVLRTLIIISLVLAFARPTLKSGDGGFFQERSPIAAVILLDNSLSLNEVHLTGSLLEELRQRFVDLKSVFRNGDRITVIQTTRPPTLLARNVAFSDDVWDDVLKKIQPNYLRSDLVTALRQAEAILKESPFANREIYLLSDLQRTAFSRASAEELSPVAFRVVVIPLTHRASDNLSIDSVEVRTRLVERNQPLHLRAFVTNPGSDRYLNSLVSVVLNGKRVAQEKASVAPGRREAIDFQVTLTESGFIEGYVELESDALLEDNRRYFHLYVPQSIAILHLVGSNTLRSFVPYILQPALERGIFRYQKIAFTKWSAIDFREFDFVIVEGVDGYPETFLSRLSGFVNRGGGLLLIPPERPAFKELQRFFDQFRLGKVVEMWGQPGNVEQFLTLRHLRWQHPIFEGLFQQTPPQLNPIEVYAGLRLLPTPAAEVLITAGDRLPYLVLRPASRGLVFAMMSPLQERFTRLPLKGLVIPLFYRMIYYSALFQQGEPVQLYCGQPFVGTFGHLTAPFDFTVKDPVGHTVRLNAALKGGQVLLEFRETQLPGNYRVYHRKRILTLFSVNVDPAESIFETVPEEELARWIPDRVILVSDQPVAAQIQHLRFGRELWPYFLMLALLLLVVEMAVARTAGKEEPVPEMLETTPQG